MQSSAYEVATGNRCAIWRIRDILRKRAQLVSNFRTLMDSMDVYSNPIEIPTDMSPGVQVGFPRRGPLLGTPYLIALGPSPTNCPSSCSYDPGIFPWFKPAHLSVLCSRLQTFRRARKCFFNINKTRDYRASKVSKLTTKSHGQARVGQPAY
jgi:hypothetical protein